MKVTLKQRITIFLSLIILLHVLVAYALFEADTGNFDNGFLIFVFGSYVILLISFVLSIFIDDEATPNRRRGDEEFHSC